MIVNKWAKKYIWWLLDFFSLPDAVKIFLIIWLKYADRASISNMWLYKKREYSAFVLVLEKMFALVLMLESTVSSSYFVACNRNKHCDLKTIYPVINHVFLPWGISLRRLQFNTLLAILPKTLDSLQQARETLNG